MKPYGRRNRLMYNLQDNHPPKGYVNWWEVEYSDVSKKRERRNERQEIRKEREFL